MQVGARWRKHWAQVCHKVSILDPEVVQIRCQAHIYIYAYMYIYSYMYGFRMAKCQPRIKDALSFRVFPRKLAVAVSSAGAALASQVARSFGCRPPIPLQ